MILETSLRTAIAVAIAADVDSGAGNGSMQFETVGDVEVATIGFNATAFAEAAGVLTLNGTPLSDASATGNASPVAQASVYDGNSAKLWENTVAVSGSEIDLSSLVIAALEAVDLTSFTVTVPAS